MLIVSSTSSLQGGWKALPGLHPLSHEDYSSCGKELTQWEGKSRREARTTTMTEPTSKKAGFKKVRSATFSIDGFSFTIGKRIFSQCVYTCVCVCLCLEIKEWECFVLWLAWNCCYCYKWVQEKAWISMRWSDYHIFISEMGQQCNTVVKTNTLHVSRLIKLICRL